MGENSVNFGEMLPIPAELIEESKKNIAIVQDSGQVIDMNEQAQQFLTATSDLNEWNKKFASKYGPVASNHPNDCYVKQYIFDEGVPISEVQKIMGISDSNEIIELVKERCGMWFSHMTEVELLYKTLPGK